MVATALADQWANV